MFSFDAIPEKADYLAGERIALKLRVENAGPGAIDLPDPKHAASDQPTIALIGPAFPHGKVLNNLGALREAKGDPSFTPTSPAPRIRIAAGDSWEGITDLTALTKVSDPGVYRVRAVLDYQDVRTSSKEARFQVRAMAPALVRLGFGVPPDSKASGRLVFIQGGGNPAGVYASRFDQDQNAPGGMAIEPPAGRAAVNAGATDLAIPWKNAPFFSEPLQWIVWRERRSIKGLSSVMNEPLSVDLPAEPAYLVQPPLKTSGGPVEVLAVSATREEISLVDFSSSPVGRDPYGRIVWKNRLPAPPTATAITAALAPASRQSERHIALAIQRQPGFEIFHSRYTESGLAPFQSVRVQAGRLLADTPPALFASDTGRATVGVLTAPDGGSDACIVVEAEFDASGKSMGRPRLTTFPLPGRPTSGAVLYSQHAGGVNLDVVVAVLGTGLMYLDRPDHMGPVAVQGTPTRPILLAPGVPATFVLYTDPKRGLYFEAL